MATRIAVIIVAALSIPQGSLGQILDPLDVASVRYWNQVDCGGLCEILAMGVRWGDAPNNGFEDRTLLLYDLSAYDDPGQITQAVLDFALLNFDPGPPVGVIDIYVEGKDIFEIPLEAFFDEQYKQSFENDESAYMTVDVTDLVKEVVADPYPHLFIRLSTLTSDRFTLGTIGVDDPTLIITPEPSACFLFLACATWMLRRPLVRPGS